VTAPERPPENPAEIAEARLFAEERLPGELAHGMTVMLEDARAGRVAWE
jgi:8-oxo-dGTP diphosphatase